MRKLATFSLGYSTAVFAATYVIPREWQLLFAAIFGGLTFITIFLKGDLRLRVALISISVSLGFLWSWGHYKLVIAPAEAIAGDKITVTAKVLDYILEGESGSSVSVKFLGEEIPHVKATIYSFDSDFPELKPGDIIEAQVKIVSATVRYGAETDMYSSRGIFSLAYLNGDVAVVDRWKLSFIYFPKTIAREIKTQCIDSFPDDVAGLMKALLTGDTSDLRKNHELYTALGATGLMHAVAISGMNVAYIVGFVRVFTGKRRRSAAICIPLILIYMSMSGGSASVVRAGLMQILMLLAPMLRRENDTLTTLSSVLAVLLLINPASAAGVGLQLSFSAMVGVLVVTPRIYKSLSSLLSGTKLKKNKLSAWLSKVLINSFSSTIGAIVFSTPLVAVHFSYVSLYGILTNMLCLWAISICFISGYFICVAGLIWAKLGYALGWIASWLLRYVVVIVKFISNLPYSAVYTNNKAVVWWLVLTYAIFILTYCFKGKRPYRPILPACLSIVLLSFVLFMTSLNFGGEGVFTAIDVGQGQSIAIISGNSTVVVDCGGKGATSNAGDATANYLLGQGRSKIDLLVLTHFHEDHANGVEALFSRLQINRLAVSLDSNDDEELRDEILGLASKYNTEIIYITEDYEITVGGINLDLFSPIGYSDSNERGIIVAASVNDFDALITGDANSTVEKSLISKAEFPHIELLVAGHHGSRYSTSEELLEVIKPEIAIISVGYNSYGHPTQDVLDRLDAIRTEIYRTDLMGNVSIKIN